MPFFKTTKNIFVDFGEYFDENWFDSDSICLPPKEEWDYKRELLIEDVDIWETIYEENSFGVYASWSPYAEFYLIKPSYHMLESGLEVETFYGKTANARLKKRLLDFNIRLPEYTIWVDPKDLWLYSPKS